MFKKAKVIFFLKNNSNDDTINVFRRLYEDNSIQKTQPQYSANQSAVDDFNFYKNLPTGTILARPNESNSDTAFFCLPMLSSHISLPVKPGEFIWVFESEDAFYPEGLIKTKPLLQIKHYWLSRIHGTLISEDVNYTDIQRDALITKKIRNRAAGNSDNNQNINLPSFDTASVLPTNSSSNTNLGTESLYKTNAGTIKPKFVPRYFPENNEFLLQGSHNAAVSLKSVNIKNKPMGAVDIVTGRMSIPKDESDIVSFDNLTYVSSNGKKENIAIKMNGSIKNESGHPENFKSASYYLADPGINDIHEKANFSYTYDASRVFLSEKVNIDNTSFYNTTHLKSTSVLSDETNLVSIPSDKMSINEESKLEFTNRKTSNLKPGNTVFGKAHHVPSVLVKSNNIRIVARSEVIKDEGEVLQAGSIRLIKQSKDYDNFACLNLEKNGDIVLNGRTIMLGDFRESTNSHGEGDGVLIGYNETISEPLVLGKTLESFLKEILYSNIKIVEEMKILSDALKIHTHKGVMPGQGISLEPLNTVPYEDYSDTESVALIERYTNIQDNLFRLLSRFAKTS